MKNVVVVIPVYQSVPKEEEIASFMQCLTVLRNYNIVLLTYKDLICDAYERIAIKCNKEIDRVNFDKAYFCSIEGYNRLCLDKMFYERFGEYEYMLIYQLDAWVFRDELSFWCSQGYDYIGAPWFKEINGHYSYEFSGSIGNGGFSLRKISFCLHALNYNKYSPVLSLKCLWDMSDNVYDLLKNSLKSIGIHNNRSWFVMTEGRPVLNEDLFFSLFKYSYMNCHFPNYEDAVRFSFEVHPSYMYELNRKKLPFGCHAYRKYEYDTFWYKYIKDDICDYSSYNIGK